MARRISNLEPQIIKLYLSGLSAETVANKVGTYERTILRVLHRTGTPVRGQGHPRHHDLDESFFDKIDSEAKAYWLGFVTADGAIIDRVARRGTQYQISVRLQLADSDHLEKMRADFGSSCQVKEILYTYRGRRYACSGLTLSSKRLVKQLKKLGVGPRKSLTVKPCREIPRQLQHHYWRGVFDGDGCLTSSIRPSGLRVWGLGLAGSQAIVTGFRNYLLTIMRSVPAVHPHRSIFVLKAGGLASPQCVAHILYDGSSVYLDRKKALVDELFAQKPIKRRWDAYIKGVAA